jgi:hypothetical protein
MIAPLLVILFNIVVLMWSSSYVENDFLKFSAWLLSFIWIVSFINTIVHKVFGKR